MSLGKLLPNFQVVFILALLAFFQNVQSAWAYIPPSQYLLKSWLNKHSGVRSVRIKTVVSELKNEKPTDVHFRETTYFQFDKQVLKSFVTDDSERRLFTIERPASRLSPVAKLLFGTDLRDVIRTLKEKKVPIRSDEDLLALRTEAERQKAETEFLGRLNAAVAWVIGTPAGSKDNAGSEGQLWFEKDTFLPLRFIFTNSYDGDLYDVRFENYRFYREFPFPRTVTFFKKGQNEGKISQVVDFAVNVEAPSGKFSHSGTPEGGFTDAGNSAPSRVRDLIRSYYELAR